MTGNAAGVSGGHSRVSCFARTVVIRLGLLAVLLFVRPMPSQADEMDHDLLLDGFRAYHSVCNHCHGPDGLGSSFGPSLVDTPPDPDQFITAIRDGVTSGSGVMKGFGDNADVMNRAASILAYIEARSTGALGRGRPPKG